MGHAQAQAQALSSARYGVPVQGYAQGGLARAQFEAASYGNGMMHSGVFGVRPQYPYRPVPHAMPGSLAWATNVLRQPEYNFSDGGGWKGEQYRSTIHVVNVKGAYLVVGRSSCGIRIIKAAAGGAEVLNDCDIPFSDDDGWDQHRYYSTIQVAVVRDELFVLGRGKCGMYIYRLVGKSVELMNKCGVPFADNTEWSQYPYYATIHTAIANDMLFIVGRASCGVVIYKLDYKTVMEVSNCGLPLSDREGWIFRRFYLTFDTSVVANEVYVIARSFYGMVIYKTIAGNRIKMVSDSEIKFSDAHGWGSTQYYETILSIEDSSGIFIVGRDTCGMRIYKLIGNDIFSINQCDIEFSDEKGWGMRKYYSTIGAKVVNDELYVYGRGACGMYVYKFAPGSTNATELSTCKIPFSDKNGWDDEKYYSSVHGSAGEHGLLIYARSSLGLSIYEQVGTNIHNVSHWM